MRAHEDYVPAIDDLAMRARIAWEYPLDGTTLLLEFIKFAQDYRSLGIVDGKPVMTSLSRFEKQVVEPTQSWNDPEGLLETFVESVKDRLMADVPVGIVLSGGLDSSLGVQLQERPQNVLGNLFLLVGQ